MSSFEATPQQSVSPERSAAERHEAFLSKDRRQVNFYLGAVFDYIDKAKGKGDIEKTNDEIEAAKAAGDKDLAFLSQYGVRTLEACLDGLEVKIPAARCKEFLDEYKEFCDVLAQPDLRPRLLSQMCLMDPNEPWLHRRAFTRLMYELYGREKVLSRDQETGEEKGFLNLEGQADLVEAWNIKGEWGFSKEEFKNIREQIPDLRERMLKYDGEPLVAPVLVPYLADEHRTFKALRYLMEVPQPRAYVLREFDAPAPDNLRLHSAVVHKPGLAFEIIDLGDNHSSDVDPVNAAHAGVLAAAALHPEWVQAMNGGDVPDVWAAGYEVVGDDWGLAPHIRFVEEGCGLDFTVKRIDESTAHDATPTFRK